MKFLTSNKSVLEKKVNIPTLSGYFPFFIWFFCWNEISKKSSMKEDTQKMKNFKANHILDRSSHRRCSVRKDVLRNFATFTGKHLCQGLFMSGPKACNFIKKWLWHCCFPVNFAKFLRTPFLQNTSGWLLLFRVNRVSDYLAKSIYIKVFLRIIVLRMLVPSKILRIRKNTYYKRGCRSSAPNFTRNFILQDLFYTFCFLKNKTPVLFSNELITFNSNW